VSVFLVACVFSGALQKVMTCYLLLCVRNAGNLGED